MRTGLLSLAALLFVTLNPGRAQAIDYPWCADLGKDIGATNCGFVTREQCQATISGLGGFCMPNPSWRAPSSPRPQRRTVR